MGSGLDRLHPLTLIVRRQVSTDPGPDAWVPVMMDIVDIDADDSGQSGHHRLVRDLFERCYGELVGLAGLVLGDRAAAEDVVQDAFAGLYRRGRLDHADGGVGYLRRSVVNLARGRLRRQQIARRRRPLTVVAPGPKPADEVAVVSDDARAVALALAKLPMRQRECVAACLMLGLSHREAAGALGISAGSVKTHVHRGSRRLADLLADRKEA